MGRPWEAAFFPEWVWHLMTNLGLVAALIAAWASLVWVWNRGPALLIKFGPKWMTTMGHWWGGKRDG